MSNAKIVVPFVVRREAALKITVFGDEILIHLTAETSGGRFSIIQQNYAKSEWGWEHRHKNEDHFVQIVAGAMEFNLGGTLHACQTGDAIFIPRNTWHKFRTTSTQEATMLFFNFPGGLEKMFLEIAAAEQRPGGADDAAAVAIALAYGVDVRSG